MQEASQTGDGLVQLVENSLSEFPQRLRDSSAGLLLEIMEGLRHRDSDARPSDQSDNAFEAHLSQYLKGLYINTILTSLKGMAHTLSEKPDCATSEHIQLIHSKLTVIDSLPDSRGAYHDFDRETAFGVDNILGGHILALGIIAKYANTEVSNISFANIMSLRYKSENDYMQYFRRARTNFASTAAVRQLMEQVIDHLLTSPRAAELVDGLSNYMVMDSNEGKREMKASIDLIAKRPYGQELLRQTFKTNNGIMNFAPFVDRKIDDDCGRSLIYSDFNWMCKLPDGYRLVEYAIVSLNKMSEQARRKSEAAKDRIGRARIKESPFIELCTEVFHPSTPYDKSVLEIVSWLYNGYSKDKENPLRVEFLANLSKDAAQAICDSLSGISIYESLPISANLIIEDLAQHDERDYAQMVADSVIIFSDRIDFVEHGYARQFSAIFGSKYDDIAANTAQTILTNHLKKRGTHKFCQLFGKVLAGASEYAMHVVLDVGLGVLGQELTAVEDPQKYSDAFSWACTLGNSIKNCRADVAPHIFDALIGAYAVVCNDAGTEYQSRLKGDFSYYIRGALNIEGQGTRYNGIGEANRNSIREKSEHSVLIRQLEEGTFNYDSFITQATRNTPALKRK